MAGALIQLKPRARPVPGGFRAVLQGDVGYGPTLDKALEAMHKERNLRITREAVQRRAQSHFKHVKEVAAERAK